MPIRILFVDDEPDLEMLVCSKYRKQIRKGQLEFSFAQNGKAALETFDASTEQGSCPALMRQVVMHKIMVLHNQELSDGNGEGKM